MTFCKKMNAKSSILGTWKTPSSMVEGADEFMHVGEDGRIVHFVYTESSGKRFVPMMLWAEALGEGRYWIRARPGQNGWSVRMVPTDCGMTIDRTERQFDFVAASESEIPDWYHERLEDALSRMDKREQEENKAEQGGDGDAEEAV